MMVTTMNKHFTCFERRDEKADDAYFGADKRAASRELDSVVANFLANGGEIKRFKPGVSGYVLLSPAEKKRRYARVRFNRGVRW